MVFVRRRVTVDTIRLHTQQGQQSAIELRGAESPLDAEIEDIWIDSHPIGIMLQNAKNRDKMRRRTHEFGHRYLD
ncbi:hypothetical protein ACFFQF_18690 [Haladaptatus pallidirubidus]|uniref:hypothetical protein n=1 Tax=Haladaptatus pallidirubidus TaxID=1008152 RepID=UPI0035E9AAA0